MHDPHDDSMAFLAPPCKNRYMTEGTSAPTLHANTTNTRQWAMALSIVEKGPQLRYNKHTSAKVWPKSVAIASWSLFLHVRRTYLLLPFNIHIWHFNTWYTIVYQHKLLLVHSDQLNCYCGHGKRARSFVYLRCILCRVNSMTLEAPKIIRWRLLCSFLRS